MSLFFFLLALEPILPVLLTLAMLMYCFHLHANTKIFQLLPFIELYHCLSTFSSRFF
jgi:hypothetical protein